MSRVKPPLGMIPSLDAWPSPHQGKLTNKPFEKRNWSTNLSKLINLLLELPLTVYVPN